MALVDTEDDGNKVLPLSGYAITCVLCFFSFKYAGEDFSMALMWWYTLCDDTGDRDKATSMWLVKLEYKDGELHLAVVPVASLLCAAHLMPFFGWEVLWNPYLSESLDVYAQFYVNKYADHQAFKLL